MVGLVCGMKCGISERMAQLRMALAHARSRNETLERSATSCTFVNSECEPPKACSSKFPCDSGSSPMGPTRKRNSFTDVHFAVGRC
jgi:hypothetical protein